MTATTDPAPRKRRIYQRYDDLEHADLTDAAKRHDVRVSQFVRDAALTAARANPPAVNPTGDGLAGAVLDAHRVCARMASDGLPEPLGIAISHQDGVVAVMTAEGIFAWQVHLTGAKVKRPTSEEARNLLRDDPTPVYFETVGMFGDRRWKLRNASVAPAEPVAAVDAELVEEDDETDWVMDLTREQALDVRRIMARSHDPLRELAAHGYRVGYDARLAADATAQFAAVTASGNGHVTR